MNTKEKILQTALKLFNDNDTKSITTNHIAKAAGISPGNLYYHFKNKEDIIRALYRQMRDIIDFENKRLPDDLCEMKNYCDFVAKTWWEYRFLRKELLLLINRDKHLANEVLEDNKKQYEKLLKLISHLIEKGCLKEIPKETITYLADTIMLYSQFWTPYLLLLGEKVDKKSVKRVTEQIERVFYPYLTEKSFKNLQECKS
ncbi:TetR/AcrR family transcriptional regulator [Nitrosophilus labii]|uniref:TetR/AcrR family transcriptional regulator n=1 Tax=Nitrosophilus labii TaxID=2706014 RepID=UPI001656D69B|nr:TetR/AcrR family transcriptional regulator [Nitrosophilus labii]